MLLDFHIYLYLYNVWKLSNAVRLSSLVNAGGMMYKSDISFHMQYTDTFYREHFVLKLISSFIYYIIYILLILLLAKRNTRERGNGIDQRGDWLMIGGKEKPSSRLVASSERDSRDERAGRGHAPSHPSRFIDRIAETQVTIVVGSATRGREYRDPCTCTRAYFDLKYPAYDYFGRNKSAPPF